MIKIKILKHGVPKSKENLFFVCNDCGTIWKATELECRRIINYYNKNKILSYSCDCPLESCRSNNTIQITSNAARKIIKGD